MELSRSFQRRQREARRPRREGAAKGTDFFTKGPDTVIGPHDPIAFDPRISGQWDYEAELAVVIGKTGRSIAEREAASHIFGHCLANDISQRDLQRRHGGQWFKGKSIDGTMPMGPYIVTPDEVDFRAVRLQCLLNGEIRQDALISQMAFPIEKLIAELSFGMTLRPGDILLTGTPSGVGFARTPPILLTEGMKLWCARLVLANCETGLSASIFLAIPTSRLSECVGIPVNPRATDRASEPSEALALSRGSSKTIACRRGRGGTKTDHGHTRRASLKCSAGRSACSIA
ncbi:fumarylacetoacetate hydrolase family protein [Bradyrhizobium sp. RDT10]